MKQILIVEDDKNLGASLVKIVEAEGMKAILAGTLAEAHDQVKNKIDVIVLDWMLPDGQGIDFLRGLRSSNNFTPVILLTARTELVDKVLGLETGACDYMTKPFEPRELIARIRVQIRDKNEDQSKAKNTESLTIGSLTIDFSARDVFFEEKKVGLTKMEYDLLKLLTQNPKQTFTRENLLDKVWGYENYPTTRTVDNHVLQIRQKTSETIIETVRGLGYRLGNVGQN
jgi:DNA-binding response OmpR family regulator